MMIELKHTVPVKELLSIPFPKTEETSFFLVDIKSYLEDLKRKIKLYENNEDWHKDHITSVWASTNPEEALKQMKNFRSEYDLIMLGDGMDPECYLHTLTKTEMQAMAELKPWELDSKASEYCAKLAKICLDNADSDCVDVQEAMPSKYSPSVLKSDIQLDLC